MPETSPLVSGLTAAARAAGAGGAAWARTAGWSGVVGSPAEATPASMTSTAAAAIGIVRIARPHAGFGCFANKPPAVWFLQPFGISDLSYFFATGTGMP